MQHIQIHRAPAAGKLLAEIGPQRPAFQADIRRGKGNRLQSVLSRNPDCARTMKFLGNDRALRQAENLLRANHGIQRAKPGVIAGDGAGGNARGHQCVAHVRRLVVGGDVIIAAHQQMMDFPGAIQVRRRLDALVEMQIRFSVPGQSGGSQNQTHVVRGNGFDGCENPARCRIFANAIRRQYQ